jgi:hypothetical protein
MAEYPGRLASATFRVDSQRTNPEAEMKKEQEK